MAKGAMVSVLPRAVTMGSRNAKPMQVMTAPQTKDPKKPEEAYTEARSVSRPPSALAMALPAPWPNMKAKAWMIDMNPKTIPTAPEALLPSCPTKAVSTRL